MGVKEKIIDAAERSLMEKGSHASSVKAIASMAGVNHGLIHHYFGSKEELYIALLERHYELIRPPRDGKLRSEEEIISYLRNYLVANSKLLIEFRSLSFQMPELSRALTSMALNLRRDNAAFFNMEDEQVLLLLSSVSGLGIHSSLDGDVDMDKYLRKIVRTYIPTLPRR